MRNEVDPRFSDNIDRLIRQLLQHKLFHVSANSYPKGDSSKRPQDQAPMMVHVVRATDAAIFCGRRKIRVGRLLCRPGLLKPTIAS
jgi:4-hydroxyphenylacetate 3-monooxygenase